MEVRKEEKEGNILMVKKTKKTKKRSKVRNDMLGKIRRSGRMHICRKVGGIRNRKGSKKADTKIENIR